MLTSLLFLRALCQPSKIMTGTMAPMGGASWVMGAMIAPTASMAHQCGMKHCVGVMDAPGVPYPIVFATSHPTHPHPIPPHSTPLCIPPNPSISNTDVRKEQQKCNKIEPSVI